MSLLQQVPYCEWSAEAAAFYRVREEYIKLLSRKSETDCDNRPANQKSACIKKEFNRQVGNYCKNKKGTEQDCQAGLLATFLRTALNYKKVIIQKTGTDDLRSVDQNYFPFPRLFRKWTNGANNPYIVFKAPPPKVMLEIKRKEKDPEPALLDKEHARLKSISQVFNTLPRTNIAIEAVGRIKEKKLRAMNLPEKIKEQWELALNYAHSGDKNRADVELSKLGSLLDEAEREIENAKTRIIQKQKRIDINNVIR